MYIRRCSLLNHSYKLQVTPPLYKLKTINTIATMNANKSTRNNVTINRKTCPPYS